MSKKRRKIYKNEKINKNFTISLSLLLFIFLRRLVILYFIYFYFSSFSISSACQRVHSWFACLLLLLAEKIMREI